MTKIVYDDTAQTYVVVELPNYMVDKYVEKFRELDDCNRNGTTMAFVQFLIWESECDVNPNHVTEVASEAIPEVRAE